MPNIAIDQIDSRMLDTIVSNPVLNNSKLPEAKNPKPQIKSDLIMVRENSETKAPLLP